jgi:hypothetical protein
MGQRTIPLRPNWASRLRAGLLAYPTTCSTCSFSAKAATNAARGEAMTETIELDTDFADTRPERPGDLRHTAFQKKWVRFGERDALSVV